MCVKGRDGACFHAVKLPRKSWQLEHNQSRGLFLLYFPTWLDSHRRFLVVGPLVV